MPDMHPIVIIVYKTFNNKKTKITVNSIMMNTTAENFFYQFAISTT